MRTSPSGVRALTLPEVVGTSPESLIRRETLVISSRSSMCMISGPPPLYVGRRRSGARRAGAQLVPQLAGHLDGGQVPVEAFSVEVRQVFARLHLVLGAGPSGVLEVHT